jgi:hypothetical protein
MVTEMKLFLLRKAHEREPGGDNESAMDLRLIEDQFASEIILVVPILK